MSRIMDHREVNIQRPNNLRVGIKNSLDDLSSESFLPKSSLDVVQNFGVASVVLVEDILEVKIRRPETITEVLGEDPTTVYMNPVNKEWKVAEEAGAYKHR
jgi:hypothetical protein